MDQLKALNRQNMWDIWQKAKLGETIEGEAVAIAAAMREHPEYTDIWDHLDKLPDEQIMRDGVNPILHVQMHAVVENQLDQNNPAGVSQILAELLRKKRSRHEAIHMIAMVLIEEIADMLKKKRYFEEARYMRKLRRLI